MEYEEIANLVSDSSKIPAMRRVALSRSKVMEGFEKSRVASGSLP